jgi:thiol-disulfide isomerase/thioredoxin
METPRMTHAPRRRCAVLAISLGLVALMAACGGGGGDDTPETAGQLDRYGYEQPDGTPATLADVAAGGPLVVNFFASWCGPCKAEMPDFEAVSQAVGDQVTFLGLAVHDAADAAQGIIDETGVTYPWGLDSDDLLVEFDGIGMPTTVFFAPDGEYIESHVGVLSADELEAKLAEHFGVTM